MRLFHILHRVYVATGVVLIVAVLGWVYVRTGISEPFLDLYAVWRNKSEVSVKPVAEISGTVIKVLDGTSFTLRATDRQLFNVALLGAVPAPPPKSKAAESAPPDRSKAQLTDLILSNDVQVTFTWLDPSHRGTGLVYLGDTNINARMVESGLVGFKREFIKGLPLRDQYPLLRAERKSREHKLSSSN